MDSSVKDKGHRGFKNSQFLTSGLYDSKELSFIMMFSNKFRHRNKFHHTA